MVADCFPAVAGVFGPPSRPQNTCTWEGRGRTAVAAEQPTSSFMDLSPLEPPPLEKVKMRGWVVAMVSGFLLIDMPGQRHTRTRTAVVAYSQYTAFQALAGSSPCGNNVDGLDEMARCVRAGFGSHPVRRTLSEFFRSKRVGSVNLS